MTSIPDFIVSHIITCDRKHSEQVAALLGALTDRERRIVETAAITGHALGVPGGYYHKPPRDSKIVAWVTEASPEIPADLTPREAFLLHDAAVMGFVRGGISGADLGNAAVVEHVVACCQSMSDLYPVLAGDMRELITRLVCKHQPVEESRLVDAVAELCACEINEVTAVVGELVGDDELTETGYGLKIGDAA